MSFFSHIHIARLGMLSGERYNRVIMASDRRGLAGPVCYWTRCLPKVGGNVVNSWVIFLLRASPMRLLSSLRVKQTLNSPIHVQAVMPACVGSL